VTPLSTKYYSIGKGSIRGKTIRHRNHKQHNKLYKSEQVRDITIGTDRDWYRYMIPGI
jgi:hypothetical protein